MISRCRHIGKLLRGIAVFMALFVALSALPAPSHAVTSEELFAEVEGIMQEIDVLQTNINQERENYETALTERDEAEDAAAEAQQRILEEQRRMKLFQKELALIMTNMYKTNDASSFFDVMLGSATFEEFLTNWDAISAFSVQGSDLVRDTKAAKAAEEAAKAEYERQQDIASQKMEEAKESEKRIEEQQEALREEAEKITKEAAELQAQEELEREAARQAALAAEAAAQARTMITTQSQQYGGIVQENVGLLGHPLPTGVFSSGFGFRDLDGGTFHQGLDLAAVEGTPYYAAANGTVIYATNDGGYNGGAGNWVVIAHGNGLVTKYMHSSVTYVKAGDVVEKGQTIGAVGNTGYSYGAHLHFQVEYNGVAIDPLAFL